MTAQQSIAQIVATGEELALKFRQIDDVRTVLTGPEAGSDAAPAGSLSDTSVAELLPAIGLDDVVDQTRDLFDSLRQDAATQRDAIRQANAATEALETGADNAELLARIGEKFPGGVGAAIRGAGVRSLFETVESGAGSVNAQGDDIEAALDMAVDRLQSVVDTLSGLSNAITVVDGLLFDAQNAAAVISVADAALQAELAVVGDELLESSLGADPRVESAFAELAGRFDGAVSVYTGYSDEVQALFGPLNSNVSETLDPILSTIRAGADALSGPFDAVSSITAEAQAFTDIINDFNAPFDDVFDFLESPPEVDLLFDTVSLFPPVARTDVEGVLDFLDSLTAPIDAALSLVLDPLLTPVQDAISSAVGEALDFDEFLDSYTSFSGLLDMALDGFDPAEALFAGLDAQLASLSALALLATPEFVAPALGEDKLTFFGGGAAQSAAGGGPDAPDGAVLFGAGGADSLAGAEGDDFLLGAEGDDDLSGGLGSDLIFGGAGDDNLSGGDGDDILEGGFGDDTLFGSGGEAEEGAAVRPAAVGVGGADLISGGEGADLAVGGMGRDTIEGGLGRDTIEGGGGADSLSGGRSADMVLAGLGRDTVSGDAGNDTILGGGGRDILSGGGGRDSIGGAGGADAITGGGGADRLLGNGGGDQLKGAGGADRLIGGGGADRLEGGAGGDTLSGGGGDDTLIGGRGPDILRGGAGADVFTFRPRDQEATVSDYRDGIDRIALNNAGPDGFDGLSLVDVSGDAVIRFGAVTITLTGVEVGVLDQDDFIF